MSLLPLVVGFVKEAHNQIHRFLIDPFERGSFNGTHFRGLDFLGVLGFGIFPILRSLCFFQDGQKGQNDLNMLFPSFVFGFL